MKLFLTSRGLQDEGVSQTVFDRLGARPQQLRLLFIPTAVYGHSRKNKLLEGIYETGFLPEQVTWFDHRYIDRVSGPYDLIYTCGGNTFRLLSLLRPSGFLPRLRQMILDGTPYLGASAGTHLVTESIEHLSYFDDNKFGVTDFSGMGLFKGVCVCHYGPERFAVTESLKKAGTYPVYPLDNRQILIAEGPSPDALRTEILTPGAANAERGA